jgi:hypothetical protein
MIRARERDISSQFFNFINFKNETESTFEASELDEIKSDTKINRNRAVFKYNIETMKPFQDDDVPSEGVILYHVI